MVEYFSKALRRLVEVVGVVTALVFVFEVTTANRSLPSIDLGDFEVENPLDFFEVNNRSVIYVSFDLHRGIFADASIEMYNDKIAVDLVESLGAPVFLVNWESLSNSYLADASDQRAEDLSLAFSGPAYARLFEAEGVPYVELVAPPFTDSVLERAKCSEHILGQSTFQKIYRYVAGCMLNTVAPPKPFRGDG
ncbi:hypothetical protein [Sagittula sp. P11]|uniref:hypothetical protein n=1 Tax=Sagittula sp. P11 TaxID=2009329 RepID=UPI0012FE103B|nr:hypothetical protein [Sagittula sp. P11]